MGFVSWAAYCNLDRCMFVVHQSQAILLTQLQTHFDAKADD